MPVHPKRVLVLLSLLALVLAAVPVGSPKANIATIVVADAGGQPTDSVRADEALYALAITDIQGGRVCVISDPNADTCDVPAFGTPNYVTGIGTNHVLLEAPLLPPGQYYLLAETYESGLWLPSARSEQFTVATCDGTGSKCNPEYAMGEVTKWKQASAKRTAGGVAFCTSFKIKEAYDKATAIAAGEFGGLAVDYIREKLGLDALTPEELAMKMLNVVSCNIAKMHEDIVADPPDPNFTQLATINHITLDASTDPTEQHFAEAMENERAIARAMLTSYERYLGAKQADNTEWQAKQARATGTFGLQLVRALRESDAATTRLLEATSTRVTDVLNAVPIVTSDVAQTVADVTQRLRTSGFTHDEVADLQSRGLDADDRASLLRDLTTVKPALLTPGKSRRAVVTDNRGDINAVIEGTDAFARAALLAADLLVPPVTVTMAPTFEVEAMGTLTIAPRVTVRDGSKYTLLVDYGDGSAPNRYLSHYYANDGTYDITVTATTEAGEIGVASAKVTVTNKTPEVRISGGLVVAPGVERRLRVDVTDSPKDSHTFTWNFGDGTSSTQREVTHTWATSGTYEITATATDSKGAVGSVKAQMVVRDLVINLGPDQVVDEAVEVVFKPTGDVAAGGHVVWDFGDGSNVARYTGLSQMKHLYQPGRYTARLTTVDGAYSISDAAEVTVRNVAPTDAQIHTPTRPVAGQKAHLRAKWTDPGDRSRATLTWEFPDGTTLTGADVEPVLSAGSQRVKLTVDDGFGGRVQTERVVEVLAPASDTVLDSAGQEFWLGFGHNHDPSAFDYRNGKLALYVTSTVSTHGGGHLTGSDFSFEFTTTPGAVTEILVPSIAMEQRSTSGHWRSAKGLHLWAADDVTVVGFSHQDYTTDAFAALPVNTLSTDYLTLTFDEENFYSANVMVVATQDNTTVRMDPPYKGEWPQHSQIKLDKGQAATMYFQESTHDFGSGRHISADKPIAAFSMHGCANVVDLACDHLTEQLPPPSAWGTEHVTVPLKGRTKDWFMLIAAEDDSQVSITDSDGTRTHTLAAREKIQWENGKVQAIRSTKPVLIAQLSEGGRVDNAPSDPFLTFAQPVEQGALSATLVTPREGQHVHYLNLVTRTQGAEALRIDGEKPAGDWAQVPGTEYSWLTVEVSAGSHEVTSNTGFVSTVYGFGTWDSYGYPGPGLAASIADATQLVLTPAKQTAEIGSEQCLVGEAKRADGSGVESARVDLVFSGVRSGTTSLISDADGRVRLCLTSVTEGTADITASLGTLTATAQMVWTRAPSPSPSTSATASPPPSSSPPASPPASPTPTTTMTPTASPFPTPTSTATGSAPAPTASTPGTSPSQGAPSRSGPPGKPGVPDTGVANVRTASHTDP